jgi:hypothetical protein
MVALRADRAIRAIAAVALPPDLAGLEPIHLVGSR